MTELFRSGGRRSKLSKLSEVSKVSMVTVKFFIRFTGGFIVCALGIYGLLSLVLVCFGVKAGFDLQRDKCIGPFFLYRDEMDMDDTTYILRADTNREADTKTDSDEYADVDRKVDADADMKTDVDVESPNSPDAPDTGFDSKLVADKEPREETLPLCVKPGLYVFMLNRDLGPFSSGSFLVKEVVATGRCLLRQRIVPAHRRMTSRVGAAGKLFGYELTISDTKTVYLLGDAVIFSRREEHWYCERSVFRYRARREDLVPEETFGGYDNNELGSEQDGTVEPETREFSRCYRSDSRHHGASWGTSNTSFESNPSFGFSSEISPWITSEITSEISFFTLPGVVLLDSNRLYKISLDKGELFLVGATAHAFDSRLLGAVPHEAATRYSVLWHIGKPLAKARMHKPGVYSLNLWKDYKDK